jgi:hypothetical protein
MSQLDLELAALRTRRPHPSVTAWLRRHRPFDRRTIRDPHERDAYWAAVNRRLAESDASFILGQSATEPPSRPSDD